MFDSKLNFLMKLTNTTNSSLARACSLDNSYISRLRSGKRKLPSKQNYLTQIVDYLINRIHKPYQMELLTLAVGFDRDILEKEEIKNEVEQWMVNTKHQENIENYLKEIESMSVESEDFTYNQESSTNDFYYGIKGKQKAVERFLNKIIDSKKTHNLYLYSDEIFDWMVDPSFFKKWYKYMSQVLKNGNKITIIHDIDRRYGDMQASLNAWMQLYMTGQIEAWYYPGIRDGIINTTRFIAPDTAAIISNNIHNSVEENLNIYSENKKAIKAIEKEFLTYLALCEPLMKHYDIRKVHEFWDMHLTQLTSESDIYFISDSLSLISFPIKTLKEESLSIFEFAYDTIKELKLGLMNNLGSRKFIEIIPYNLLDSDEDTLPKFYKSAFLQMDNINYTKELFAKHLNNQLMLLNEVENYNLYISKEMDKRMHLQFAPNHSAIFTTPNFEAKAISFTEKNMISFLNEFIQRFISAFCITDRDEVKELIVQKVKSLS